MGTWKNADGLYIKFGTDEGVVGTGGQYAHPDEGADHIVDIEIDLTKLTTSGQAILDDNVRFPKGYRVKRVQLVTTVAATSSGAATLDFGLIRADRSTEHDYDGFAAAIALSAINAVGKTVELGVGSTGAGALVGTELAATAAGAYPVAKAGTATFTAGKVRARVYLFKA